MSRPKTYGDRVHIMLRLPADLHARLRDAADERDVSINLLASRAIERLVDEWGRLNECPQHFGLPGVADCPDCPGCAVAP